jgi:large subunit ribosomal protein L19
MGKIEEFQSKRMKKDITKFSIGDTVRVHLKIVEGDKQRIQQYEGIVIAKKHGGISETFTVRRISYGEGVERTFLMHSPAIEKIERVQAGKVKRAKLYYLRKKVGKKTKVEEKIVSEQQPTNADAAEQQPTDAPSGE